MQQQQVTENTEFHMEQGCTCKAPARMRELCPACQAEWNAWLAEDLRQAAAYAAYGDPFRSEEAAA